MAESANQNDQDVKANKIETSVADTSSRRTFVKWIGQITAGIAIVGVGLDLANRSTPAHARPECVPCSGCVLETCEFSDLCYDDGYPYEITYIQYYDCVLPGQDCPYNTYRACQNNCETPC